DDGVLHLLRLAEAQNFGAEVLRPVGPADTAARDLAEAQVYPFEPWRIDENLVERTRQRQRIDLPACEFDRNLAFGAAVVAELIKVRTQRRGHQVDEVAEDAVLIEAFDPRERPFDRFEHFGLARLALGIRCAEAWIESVVKQFGEARGNLRMLDQ